MQSFFRRFGKVNGYYGEIFMFAIYVIYFGNPVYWNIFKPTIRLLINTSDYTCTEFDQVMFAVLLYW